MINNNKKAFTLAEVLVTLVIIGIVAALTIPVVVAKYNRKVVEVQLVKSYNTISNAVSMAELEHGPIETWYNDKNDAVNLFEKYALPYIKNSSNGVQKAEMSEIGYKERIKYPDGYSYTYLSTKPNYFKQNDGQIIFLSGSMSCSSVCTVNAWFFIVDINGPKEPNIVGRDVFVYQLPAKKGFRLQMYGETHRLTYKTVPKEEIIENCKTGESDYCGAWIKLNGWKIPDDYPYL